MVKASSLLCVVGAAIVIFAIGGCGGSCNLDTGAAAGWVYQLPDGTGMIITGSRIPPDGYEPVADAHVFIGQFPELEGTTDANGRYAIFGITPGTRSIVIEKPAGHERARYSVRVRSGQMTIGGGHSEGGGGA